MAPRKKSSAAKRKSSCRTIHVAGEILRIGCKPKVKGLTAKQTIALIERHFGPAT